MNPRLFNSNRAMIVFLVMALLSGIIFPCYAENSASPQTPPSTRTYNNHTVQNDSEAQYLDSVWTTGEWGNFIGKSGLYVVDLDGDGKTEIFYGGDLYWRVVSFNPAYATYSLKYACQQPTGTRILVARPTNTSGYLVYVTSSDGSVKVYEPITCQQVAIINLTVYDGGTGLAIADVDADGSNELVVGTASGKVFVLNAQTYQIKWSKAIFLSHSPQIYVGNVDNDPALEIVSGRRAVDGQTGALEWNESYQYNTMNGLADIDGDGRQEVLYTSEAAPPYAISAYDVEAQSLKWQIPLTFRPGSLYAGDYDQDGIVEIAVGSTMYDGNGIYIYNGQTQQFERIISSFNGDMYGSIAFGDVDGDSVAEVVSGLGYTVSGSSGGFFPLLIGSTVSNQLEWHSENPEGPFSAVEAGDVDNDGKTEIVVLSPYNNHTSEMISVYDASSHALKWEKSLNVQSSSLDHLKLSDIDGDGAAEIMISLRALDGITQQFEWYYSAEYGHTYLVSSFSDVDLDGHLELVTSEDFSESGVSKTSLNIIDVETKTNEWNTNWLANSNRASELTVCNVDSDPNPEILLATLDGLYVYDGVTHAQEWTQTDASLVSLGCGDINKDGQLEILAGTQGGALIVLNARDKTVTSTHQISQSNGPLYSFRLVDFNQDGLLELVFSDKTQLHVISTQTWKELWMSAELGSDFTGRFNHLVVADLNQDGRQEVVVGGQKYLYMFRHNPQAPGNIKPAVVSLLPNSGTVWRRQSFTVNFNEAVLPGSIVISCLPEVNGWKAYPANGFTYLLLHDPFPGGANITCTLQDAQDKFDFHLNNPSSWSVTSDTNLGSDRYLPVISR